MCKRIWCLFLFTVSILLIQAQGNFARGKDCTVTVWMKNPQSKEITVDIDPITLLSHSANRSQKKMMLDEKNKGGLKISLNGPSIIGLMNVWSDSTIYLVAMPGDDLAIHLDGLREDTSNYNDTWVRENEFYHYIITKSQELLKIIPQQDPESYLKSWDRELKAMQELTTSATPSGMSPTYATWISQSIHSLFQSKLCRQLMTYVSMTRQWPVNLNEYTNRISTINSTQFNQPDFFIHETDRELVENYYLFYSLIQDKKNAQPAPGAEATYRNAINFAKNIKTESSRNVMIRYLVTSATAHTTDTSFLKWMKSAIVFGKQNDFLGKMITEKQNSLRKIGKDKSAPGFEAADISGNKFSYKHYEGKYLYIDIWATWCIPCRQEIPYLEKLKQKYAGHPIEFISVSMDKNFGAWKKYMESVDSKNQFHSMQGDASSVNETYDADKIPTFVLIDPQGKIVNPSSFRPSDPELVFLLDELLQKK